jgi:hypothetical protein
MSAGFDPAPWTPKRPRARRYKRPPGAVPRDILKARRWVEADMRRRERKRRAQAREVLQIRALLAGRRAVARTFLGSVPSDFALLHPPQRRAAH